MYKVVQFNYPPLHIIQLIQRLIHMQSSREARLLCGHL